MANQRWIVGEGTEVAVWSGKVDLPVSTMLILDRWHQSHQLAMVKDKNMFV